ncbi:hypothetical protein CPB85DRAFT_1428824 [Mucidula mucida]|nr:hypothetical protein CPB85DRAFT_1428824 [Mucidula mucida]
MASVTAPNVNISFEPHLADILVPLRSVLPGELAGQLDAHHPLRVPSVDIPMGSIPDRLVGMKGSPLLDPKDYSMIALLAGTVTSPERKFGSYQPPPDPEVIAAQNNEERKQITTLVNALLSVGGSAFAALWASQHTGWKYEWRVLFSFFVAIVVAVSEGVLYLIWQSRREASRKLKRRFIARHKKDDGPNPEVDNSPAADENPVLRRRKQ